MPKEPKPESCNVKDWTLCILGVLIVLGFFATNLMIFLFPHDPNNVTINTILNYTNSLVVFVAGYYFGSSKSGDDKNKTISDMAATGSEGGSGPTTMVTGDQPIVNATVKPSDSTANLAPQPEKV